MGSIAIVGIGPEAGALPASTASRLRRANRVVVSSSEGSVVETLASAGIEAVSLGDLGIEADEPVQRVIERLAELARDQDVAYATGAYPFLRQGMLSGLLARSASVDVFPEPSPLQVILMAFDIDLTADLDIVDARSLDPAPDQRESHLIVTGVRNTMLARRVAERLAAVYPEDHAVVVATSLSEGGFALSMHAVRTLVEVPLAGDAALYVPPTRLSAPAGFEEFVRLVETLRAPGGCPWDRAQDHMSLRRHIIEEAYETVAAIEHGDAEEVADELGDLLLQIVLHAQIAAEEGEFTIDDVIRAITEKIRRRHPHVFGDTSATTPGEVMVNWDAIKRDEKAAARGVLAGIPRSLPALVLAGKISRRVVGVGFEWETIDDVWDKVHEEIDELKDVEPGSAEAADEIGDLLFTVVNLARKQDIDAEEALRGTCEKFTRRWEDVEHQAASEGLALADLGIHRLEELWDQAKRRSG